MAREKGLVRGGRNRRFRVKAAQIVYALAEAAAEGYINGIFHHRVLPSYPADRAATSIPPGRSCSMSTAGKVLVVLVLLVAPIWILMASTVAQLNKNAGEQLEKLKKQVATLESDVSANKKSVVTLKDQIVLEQEAMNRQLAATRAHQADLQKARSEWIEIVSREKYQVAAMQEAAKRAEATRDLRAAEKVQENAAKQVVEAEVQQLMLEHAQLTEQLDKLRGEFKATVDQNRKLMARLKAKKPS
jgi:hypothetical protein